MKIENPIYTVKAEVEITTKKPLKRNVNYKRQFVLLFSKHLTKFIFNKLIA